MFEAKRCHAQLMRRSFQDQPVIWVDTMVISFSQKRDQQPAQSKGTAPYIEHLVLLPQAQTVKKGKLSGTHEVESTRRTDIGAIMVCACAKFHRLVNRQLAGV